MLAVPRTDHTVVAFVPRGTQHATTAQPGPRIGYARDCGGGPRLSRLIARREAAGCGQVFSDAASGSASLRPGLDAALAALSPGAVLAVDSLALLTWREDGLREILFAVEAVGAHLVADAEGLDTRREGSVFDLARTMAAFAANVRAARQAEAKAGRPDRRCRISDEAWAEWRPRIVSGEVSVAEAAIALSVKRSTLYRRLEG